MLPSPPSSPCPLSNGRCHPTSSFVVKPNLMTQRTLVSRVQLVVHPSSPDSPRRPTRSWKRATLLSRSLGVPSSCSKVSYPSSDPSPPAWKGPMCSNWRRRLLARVLTPARLTRSMTPTPKLRWPTSTARLATPPTNQPPKNWLRLSRHDSESTAHGQQFAPLNNKSTNPECPNRPNSSWINKFEQHKTAWTTQPQSQTRPKPKPQMSALRPSPPMTTHGPRSRLRPNVSARRRLAPIPIPGPPQQQQNWTTCEQPSLTR